MSDKFHTLIIYTGSVETISVGCMMFHCRHGFDAPKEMIEDFLLCTYLAQFHHLVDLGKIDKSIQTGIKTEEDFLAFLKKDSTVRSYLINDFINWPTLMANEFDQWDYFEHNGWDPWRKPHHAKTGKFVELEGFESFVKAFGQPKKDKYSKINWDYVEEKIIVGSYNIGIK